MPHRPYTHSHDRADHRANGINGPAPVTNGGTALLVMRNFGYLGLHAVVDEKSTLARDRLVDFTGELQVSRNPKPDLTIQTSSDSSERYFTDTMPPWHDHVLCEPTVHGGRNPFPLATEGDERESTIYAQELAPIPLQLGAGASPSRARVSGVDIEPFYATTFCNELVFQPRILHNCPKGNIVIKAELREMEWNQDLMAYIAHRPREGPMMRNNRRGPFLVNSAFTSCSPRGSEKHFMDEFKVKLPLDLHPACHDGSTRHMALFFLVYSVKLHSKSKWKTLMSSPTEPLESEEAEQLAKARMEQLACGFLPLSTQSCIVEDGLHDVRVLYRARPMPEELRSRLDADHSALVLTEDFTPEETRTQSSTNKEESFAEDVVSNGSVNERLSSVEPTSKTEGSVHSASDLASIAEESLMSRGGKSKAAMEPLSLSVRVVVQSSVHSPSEALADFLAQETKFPRVSNEPTVSFLSTLKQGLTFLEHTVREGNNACEPSSARLLESTIDITKQQLCSLSRSTHFLWRIAPLLWRSIIAGDIEPNLSWANPSFASPLRIQSFASLLYMLGASNLFLTRSGLGLVDGDSKWNVVTLGRVLALLFDEERIFGPQSRELFDEANWIEAKTTAKRPSPRKGRHVRHTFEFNSLSTLSIEGGGSASLREFGDKAGTVSFPMPKETEPVRKEESSAKVVEPSSTSIETPQEEIKLDSKTDFLSALRASHAAEDGDFDMPKSNDESSNSGPRIQSLGALGRAPSRRWMTLPPNALSTISETDAIDEEEEAEKPTKKLGDKEDKLSSEMVITDHKTSVKQMRVPKVRKPRSADASSGMATLSGLETLEHAANSLDEEKNLVIPQSDEEIQSAGSAFLDSIGQSLGMLQSIDSEVVEERGVRNSNHRKTRSRSSIDWTLIADTSRSSPLSSSSRKTDVFDLSGNDKSQSKVSSDVDMASLSKDTSTSVRLPNFLERLAVLGKSSQSSKARWFPYAYEVIIMQWAAILAEQRVSGDRTTGREGEDSIPEAEESLALAASRAIGVAIAGAPMLFEVIKQSLGFRIACLFEGPLADASSYRSAPLVQLDDTLLNSLEQVISMVADACIDSRNFDAWELRQMSIDVNDSLVRFIRDMFSFLAPANVYRLSLAYLGRFVTKEGKQWQDRDSALGLRCSWEIFKLRMNAVTALVRFPDFIRVNSPQLLNWSESLGYVESDQAPVFFDTVTKLYRDLQMSEYVVGTESDGTSPRSEEILRLRPHWLAEVVVDICLLGTEHAEQYIQYRSASLLQELFWSCSQESARLGNTTAVASMFLTFIEKLLTRVDYVASFAPKSQLRRDVLPCLLFVLQSAEPNLLSATWRFLLPGLKGKGDMIRQENKDFSIEQDRLMSTKRSSDGTEAPDALDLICLLNLAVRTLEYEGCEEHIDTGKSGETRESLESWRRGWLLSRPPDRESVAPARRLTEIDKLNSARDSDVPSSSPSRKWQAHDASLTIVNTCHQVVLQLYENLAMSPGCEFLLNPAVRERRANKESVPRYEQLGLSHYDVVLFVRAVASLYLHVLSLRQSDLVLVRTFKLTAEMLKIFGIKIVLEAIGETLQHWMRVLSLQFGARRSQVRVEATDLLELMLRSTWECFGSFFRIRVPLLAIQTEVMERIVATAAARYYRDHRRNGTLFETFSLICAEGSLVPFWRTLDRIETQPASKNVAFRGALVRMASKLKKLYRAYIAARVLSFIQNDQKVGNDETVQRGHQEEASIRAARISVLKLLNASEAHSKQFLGFQGTAQSDGKVAHFEAVEDALINAADVFSPTELPEHRVAWLRMLADFHEKRKKYAEEATCHFYVHVTLFQAAGLHGSLWSNSPFLPWTDTMPDPVYIDGCPPVGDIDLPSSVGLRESDNGGEQLDSATSFRRIFYRVANSVGFANDDPDAATNSTLFYGVTFPSEFTSVKAWLTFREMEENMVEEAEAAGDLFLKAGIVASSRLSWTLATRHYAEKFNFAKLALGYNALARAVVSKMPSIDSSVPQEVAATLGRFYRVWFHGGAPDELSGVEFVYRAEEEVRLDQFGDELRRAIKSIIPDRTPIHLLLDGRAEEYADDGGGSNFGGFSRIGPAPLEPVRIKVTPLHPILGNDMIRGHPEWFQRYVDEAFGNKKVIRQTEINRQSSRPLRRSHMSGNASREIDPHHREHGRSSSASIFSGSATLFGDRRDPLPSTSSDPGRATKFSTIDEACLSGVDKFCFVQSKDRNRSSKEWWKSHDTDFREKSLRVTQLQVGQPFPACVARQAVVHRLVYSQSPLEAGMDGVCQWCAILFRTAVATAGQAVLDMNADPGIGSDAVKVVADCIHSSHVKEIGTAFLRRSSSGEEAAESDYVEHDKLSDDEVSRFQLSLARLLVVFIELLHVLIARNRDVLLDVIKERKSEGGGGTTYATPAPSARSLSRMPSATQSSQRSNLGGGESQPPSSRRLHRSVVSDASDPRHQRAESSRTQHRRGLSTDERSHATNLSTVSLGAGLRTDSAIAVHSELQRAFINMCKALYPRIQSILKGGTPSWLKHCGQDNYFSLGTYRQSKIPIAEELCFAANMDASFHLGRDGGDGSIAGGSAHSYVSKSSEKFGFGNF